ncbi:hypothetical protein ACFQY5_01735 [Paeniroseomonas aquatica]|uniref:hypothetical protein n=1 Tax=Paeniroseomonas aquatica TaxID=373043 RepID=UPI0036158E4F
MDELIAAHADWSIDPRKRWITVARRDAAGWRAAAPRPVGTLGGLLAGLLAPGLPVALGLDLPLGLPRAYAAGRAEAGFPESSAASPPPRSSSRSAPGWRRWARRGPSTPPAGCGA